MRAGTVARIVLTSAMLALIPAPQLGGTVAAQTVNEPVIHLNQAWSQDDREWYYNFSQGSAVIPYNMFLNVELAGGEDLFRSDANMARYGLLPQQASPNNPDALPIGISKTVVGTPVRGW